MRPAEARRHAGQVAPVDFVVFRQRTSGCSRAAAVLRGQRRQRSRVRRRCQSFGGMQQLAAGVVAAGAATVGEKCGAIVCVADQQVNAAQQSPAALLNRYVLVRSDAESIPRSTNQRSSQKFKRK